jgi:hypothetical protein
LKKTSILYSSQSSSKLLFNLCSKTDNTQQKIPPFMYGQNTIWKPRKPYKP